MIDSRRRMTWRGLVTLCVTMALFATAGCGDDSETVDREPDGEVTMKLLGRDKFCRREEPAMLAVRTTDDWGRVWADAMSETTVGHQPPPIDFTRFVVLAAFLGAGPAGRDVSIARVEIADGRVVVTWIKRDGNGVTDTGQSSPFCLVRIPTSRYEVVWQEAGSR